MQWVGIIMKRIIVLCGVITVSGCSFISDEKHAWRTHDLTNETLACTAIPWYKDNDRDGFGSLDFIEACEKPESPAEASYVYVDNDDDCDDENSNIHPAATELCDELDNDCDGLIDDDDTGLDPSEGEIFYADLDGDGDGDPNTTIQACAKPENASDNRNDCDDSSAVLNTSDADNDGVTSCGNVNNYIRDCDDFNPEIIMIDEDGDGFVSCIDDCDDFDPNINPDAAETCLDGVDSDCDGVDSTGSCNGSLEDADFIMTGVAIDDRLGQSLSYAGNITGSAVNDFAIGSRWNSFENGIVYIYSGSGPLSGSSSVENAVDVTILGENGEQFGYDIGGGTDMLGGITADFNGDGNDDLIVGAPKGDGDGQNRGRVYVFFGPLSGLLTSSRADLILLGESPTNNNSGFKAGTTVAFAGDVNDDGFADILIGDPPKEHNFGSNGEAYLIFGSDELDGNINLQDVGASRFHGVEIHSHYLDNQGWEAMGTALDAVGDVNGDGIDDIMVSAYRWDASIQDSNENSGAVFVWYGGTSLGAVDLEVSHSAEYHNADVSFYGVDSGDQIGRSASGAGDFNGDGNMDIIIGSEHFNDSQGVTYVVTGNIAGSYTLSPANSPVLLELVGENVGDAAGRWVGSAGNLDGDDGETSDILVGAKLADTNGENSGAVYVVLGGSSVTGSRSLSTADAIFSGESPGDEAGINVTGIDDCDGDDIPEILIGSYRRDSSSGAVQLIFGGTFQ